MSNINQSKAPNMSTVAANNAAKAKNQTTVAQNNAVRNTTPVSRILTGGTSANTQVQNGNVGVAYNQSYYNEEAKKIEDYTNKMLEMAGEDYNYVAKWIEATYKNALGTDDAATQEFMQKVASNLEATRGRVVYDYETGKYQLDKTYDIGASRTTVAQKLALARLAEDEATAVSDLTRQTTLEKQQLGTDLNSRGLISDSRNGQDGIAGQSIELQDEDIQARFDALAREKQRGTENTNILASNTMEDLAWNKEKGMEALTTDARRTGVDSIQQRQSDLEAAQLKKKRAEEEARRQKEYALSMADREASNYGGRAA